MGYTSTWLGNPDPCRFASHLGKSDAVGPDPRFLAECSHNSHPESGQTKTRRSTLQQSVSSGSDHRILPDLLSPRHRTAPVACLGTSGSGTDRGDAQTSGRSSKTGSSQSRRCVGVRTAASTEALSTANQSWQRAPRCEAMGLKAQQHSWRCTRPVSGHITETTLPIETLQAPDNHCAISKRQQ